jgi:hypothetical protein
MTGDYKFPGCTCPPAWWGVAPPPCPIHNPPSPYLSVVTTTATTTINGANARPPGDAMRPEDV